MFRRQQDMNQKHQTMFAVYVEPLRSQPESHIISNQSTPVDVVKHFGQNMFDVFLQFWKMTKGDVRTLLTEDSDARKKKEKKKAEMFQSAIICEMHNRCCSFTLLVYI